MSSRALGDNLVGRALAACGRSAAVRLTKRIPLGGGLGGGSADAAAVLRWAGCARPGGGGAPRRRRALLRRRRAGPGRGAWARAVTPLPFEPRDYLLLLPPFGVDRPRCTGPGTTTRATRRRTSWRRPPWRSSRGWPWRDPLGELAGSEPGLAGSGSTWFVEGGPPEAGTRRSRALRIGTETARLVRARTVPAGWEGD